MSAPATHPCDACGGTGGSSLVVAYGDVQPGDRVWNRYGYSSPRGHWTEVLDVTCDGPQHGLTTRDGYKQWGFSREGIGVQRSCPVCLGAGSFPDRMPARDALADAETLDSFVGDSLVYHAGFRMARNCGSLAAFMLSRLKPRAYKARAQAIELADTAIRSAFRAVPGLRGEE